MHSRILGVFFLFGTCVGSVASQGTSHPSTAMAIRQQWGTLAQEVVDKLQLAPHSSIELWIQSDADSVSAQNAFLEALQRRGYSPSLGAQNDSSAVRLAIAVLTNRKQMRGIGSDSYERTIQTDIEARTDRANGQNAGVLGMFHQALIDTVSAQEAGSPLPLALTTGEEHASLFQRFVGPLIVLASGVMIVYLFFTVRS